jgi:hypothetical protein
VNVWASILGADEHSLDKIPILRAILFPAIEKIARGEIPCRPSM